MSASTQAKPRGGKVSVRKAYIGQSRIAYPTEKQLYGDGLRAPCHVVTGYSGSAKTLKRLVEIAGMDEAALIACIQGPTMTVSTRHAMLIIKTLGLSSARGGRK